MEGRKLSTICMKRKWTGKGECRVKMNEWMNEGRKEETGRMNECKQKERGK
jgi:hypothetical protein